MAFTLEIQGPTGTQPRRTFEAQEQVTIGRDKGNLVVLPDDQHEVSRRHALIENRGEGYVLIDRTSRAGTLLDGERIEAEQPIALRNGATIGICGYSLRFQAEELPPDEPTIRPTSKPEVDVGEMLGRIWATAMEAAPEQRRQLLGDAYWSTLEGASDNTRLRALAQIERRFAAPSDTGPQAPADDDETYIISKVALARLAKQLFGRDALRTKTEVQEFVLRLELVTLRLVENLHTLLQGRGRVREDFNVDYSKIGLDRNPIKDSASTEDLLRLLFDVSSERPLGSMREQLDQACKELVQHQCAILGAMEASVGKILDLLSPEKVLQKERAATGLVGKILLMLGRKAPLWTRYHQMFADQTVNELASKTLRDLLVEAQTRGEPRASAPSASQRETE